MDRGLLITDFWYTRVLDPKSLVVTGLTRNGVWLVEDGEVTAAVGNMRFTQSYPQALGPGSVRGIGDEPILLPDRWSGLLVRGPGAAPRLVEHHRKRLRLTVHSPRRFRHPVPATCRVWSPEAALIMDAPRGGPRIDGRA